MRRWRWLKTILHFPGFTNGGDLLTAALSKIKLKTIRNALLNQCHNNLPPSKTGPLCPKQKSSYLFSLTQNMFYILAAPQKEVCVNFCISLSSHECKVRGRSWQNLTWRGIRCLNSTPVLAFHDSTTLSLRVTNFPVVTNAPSQPGSSEG